LFLQIYKKLVVEGQCTGVFLKYVASGASAVSRASTAKKTAGGINKRESTLLPEYCLSTVRFQQENNFLHLLSTRNPNVPVYSSRVFVLLFQKSNERKEEYGGIGILC
jgi:hypothetical protein